MVSTTSFESEASSVSEDEIAEEDYPHDEDICPKSELNKLFTIKHQIITEETIAAKRTYVLGLCSNRSLNLIAAGLSDGTVKVFDIASGGVKISDKMEFKSKTTSNITNCICGVKYLDESPNHLLVGRTDGCLSLYDLRTNNLEFVFQDDDDEDNERKPILSFDINANNRLICAGTEQIIKEAYILFFDIRQKKLLGGYLDSHVDDITSIVFHPTISDTLLTGSTDGLINIFDISQQTEDDALIKTINSESSVNRLNWHKNVYNRDIISCITHTNDLMVFNYDEGEILSEFNRTYITDAMKRKFVDDCNLINCHNLDDSILVLASSNCRKGEVVRSLKVQNKALIPYSEFEDNKQIVRESIFSKEKNLVITGGEGGMITIWNAGESQLESLPSSSETASASTASTSSSSKLKIKTKLSEKVHGKKPY